MRELRELVGIVNRHKIRSLELLGPFLPASSKIMKLYEGISSGVFESDEEAMIGLYENPEDSRNSYWKLKHDLKRRLLNTIFFIDQSQRQQTDYERAFYSCYREFTAARFLLRRGSRQVAIELLHRVLKRAKQIELTPVILETLQLLRHHYGIIVGDRKQFEAYDRQIERYAGLYLAEIRADGFLEDLLSHYVRDKSTKMHHLEKARRYETELKDLLQTTQSHKLHHRYYFTEVAKKMIANDYKATVRVCLQAIDHFQQFDHIPDSFVRTYLYQLVVSYIQLQEYHKGEASIRQLLDMLEPGQSNWFRAMELFCVLALHSKDYGKAGKVWSECTGHPGFRSLYPASKEPWYIMEAFIHFTYQAGETGKDGAAPPHSRFRRARFLNEVPVFSKDKRGYNIPILIIQILFLLNQGDTDTVYERLEAISRYAIRHFRRGEHYRTNCFIRMLNQLPKAYFRRKEVERRTRHHFEQLQNVPLGLAREAHEIEIIPYEDLWELVLENLGR